MSVIVTISNKGMSGLTPCGHKVWCARGDSTMDQWRLAEGNTPNTFKLEQLEMKVKPPNGFHWHSPHSCKITKNGWRLSSSGKQLLWLPHHWKPDQRV